MTSSAAHSPLGDPADVAAARAAYPGLAECLDDLEQIVTPVFDRADRAAVEAQAAVKRNRVVEMAGGALVTALAIVRLGIGDGSIGTVVSIVAAGVAGATSVVTLVGRQHDVESWLDNRRIAEELRSLYFRWLASADDEPSKQRRKRLRSEVNRVVEVEAVRVGAELTGEAAGGSADDLGDAAWELYRTARLRNQLNWMRAKAESVDGRSRAIGWVQTSLMVVSAVCALLAGFASGGAGLALTIVVLIAAAMVGFLAALDSVVASERLAQHYERTVQRLEVIDRALGDEVGSLDDVEEIETILMAEHRSWHRITEGNQQ